MIKNVDKEGRIIDYLRISITDRCNLRCKYCMPQPVEQLPCEEILRYEELVSVARAAAACGISHIKITGGEPLVRKDCAALVKAVKQIEGIETVTLTTNGVLLSECFADLKNAGVDGINISLDTLDRERYQEITGSDALEAVCKAIDLCMFGGIKTKLNVTVTQESDIKDVMRLAELAKEKPLDVRFIEVMPIGYGKSFEPIDNYYILKQLRGRYPGMHLEKKPEVINGKRIYTHGMGPAVYYSVPEFKGSVGFISAIHDKFCDSCNRLRLTSTGLLKYCLCYEDGIELKPILRAGLSEALVQMQLKEAFRDAMQHKPKEHHFDQPTLISERKAMASIGG